MLREESLIMATSQISLHGNDTEFTVRLLFSSWLHRHWNIFLKAAREKNFSAYDLSWQKRHMTENVHSDEWEKLEIQPRWINWLTAEYSDWLTPTQLEIPATNRYINVN